MLFYRSKDLTKDSTETLAPPEFLCVDFLFFDLPAARAAVHLRQRERYLLATTTP